MSRVHVQTWRETQNLNWISDSSSSLRWNLGLTYNEITRYISISDSFFLVPMRRPKPLSWAHLLHRSAVQISRAQSSPFPTQSWLEMAWNYLNLAVIALIDLQDDTSQCLYFYAGTARWKASQTLTTRSMPLKTSRRVFSRWIVAGKPAGTLDPATLLIRNVVLMKATHSFSIRVESTRQPFWCQNSRVIVLDKCPSSTVGFSLFHIWPEDSQSEQNVLYMNVRDS